MTQFCTDRFHDSWLTRPSYLRPVLSELRAVRDSGAGEDKMSPIKQLKCLLVGCNNEDSSRHLLPTSEPLKRINVTFVFEGDAPIPIYINAPVCTNHSWSSFIYRRSEYKGFYESLQIAFPNNVLVSQFRGWSLRSAHHPTEERGGVSRAH